MLRRISLLLMKGKDTMRTLTRLGRSLASARAKAVEGVMIVLS